MITGANRGLGLEMSRQLMEKGDVVFAACRQPEGADLLNQLGQQYPGQLEVVRMDVASDESVDLAKAAVSQNTLSLDWIINNAGIGTSQGFDEFEAKNMLDVLNTNTVGAMRVATQFIKLLRQGADPKLINISSNLGSVQIARPQWGTYAYNSSKAAMNMVTRHLSFDLADDGITVIAMHPGWVQTDMGGESADLTVPDAVSDILQVIENLTFDDNGKFFTYQGIEHPW